MNKPLQSRKIIVTRDKKQAGKLIITLQELGAECIAFPTIEISPAGDWSQCDEALRNINNYDWIIFSSANGIRYFLGRAKEINTERLGNKIAVVGKKTLRELESWDYEAELVPDNFSASGLLDAFKEEGITGKKVLLPTSEITRDELKNGLQKLGAILDRVTVYRNECRSDQDVTEILKAFGNDSIDAVLFFSPSAFNCFQELLGPSVCRDLKKTKALFAAIGPTTAETIESSGFKVDIIPEKGLQESMIQALINYFTN